MKYFKRIALLFKKNKINRPKNIIVYGSPGRGKVFSGILPKDFLIKVEKGEG